MVRGGKDERGSSDVVQLRFFVTTLPRVTTTTSN